METTTFLMVSTYYPPHHLGGDAVFVRYLSRELASRGHEVHIFHNPAAYRVIRKLAPTADGDEEGVIKHTYSTSAPKRDIGLALSLGISKKAERQLAKVVADVKPDVVHWHNTKGFLKPIDCSSKCKHLYTAHDYYLVCPKSNLLRPGLVPCDRPEWCQLCLLRWGTVPQLWRISRRRPILLPRGMIVVSPSEFMSQRLSAEGIRTDVVLRNFVPDLGRRAVKSTTEMDTVTYIGLIEKHKGVVDLLTAFSDSRANQGFRLAFVGEGSMRDYLAKEIVRLNLRTRVELHGFLDLERLNGILNRTAIQAVPSLWYENAPLVVLEAMSRGIPVLGSDRGGLPELLTEESGATVFHGGDRADLALKLAKLWESRYSLPDLGGRARSAYDGKFTPSKHIQEYTNLVKT